MKKSKYDYASNAATTAVLMEAGIDLMRQNLRRRHPEENETQIAARLKKWLYCEDDPMPGDVAGDVRVREHNP